MILVKNTNFKKVLINDINVNIPNEWVYGNLENIAIIKSGIPAPKIFNDKDFPKDKKIPFFRVSNLSKSIKYLSSENTHEFLDYNSYKKNIILKDSILIAKSGESIKKKYRNILKQDSIVVGHIAALYPKCNKDYLYHLINYQQPENYLIKGAAMPSIGLAELNKFQIFYTEDLNFQKNISKILNKQESIISNIEKLILKTEKMFEYFSEKLLSGKIILENNKLINNRNKDSIKKYKLEIFLKMYPNTKKYQIKSKDILKSGTIPVISQEKEKISGYSNQKNYIMADKNNPIIIFGDHSCTLKLIDFNFILGGDGTKVFTSNNDNETLFLYYCIKNLGLKTEGYKRHFSILKEKLVADIPNKLDVCKILLKQEQLIENQKKLLEKEKQKFEWLSEKLLSGEYLVVDEE